MKIRSIAGLVALGWAAGSVGGNSDATVEIARNDLARRLDVPLEQVQVVSRTVREWPDSRMGCERVGVPVDEVITPGSALLLGVAGKTHYYYARPGETYQYCELPSTKKRGPIGPPVK